MIGKTQCVEIVPFQLGIVRKQEADIRMNVGRPGFGGDAGIDLTGGEEIELGSALRNAL